MEGQSLDRIFTGKASGKDVNRPQLDAMLTFAREGDTVVVHSIDRLARNLDNVRKLVQSLTPRGIRIEFVNSDSIATWFPESASDFARTSGFLLEFAIEIAAHFA